jgi:hypothetical protein
MKNSNFGWTLSGYYILELHFLILDYSKGKCSIATSPNTAEEEVRKIGALKKWMETTVQVIIEISDRMKLKVFL